MKNLFLSLSLATLSLLPLGCKKADDVAPASTKNSIVGEYALSGTQTFTTNGKSATSGLQTNATLFVMGTDKADTYYFLERYGTVEAGYFVTMNNQNFTTERIVDEAFPEDKNRWIGYRTGSGSVNGNTITYQTETPTFTIQNVYYVNGTGINPTNIASMSRKVNYTATKK